MPRKNYDAEAIARLDEAFDVSDVLNFGEENSSPVMEEQIAPVEEAPVQIVEEPKAEPTPAPAASFVERLRKINADNEAKINDLFSHIEKAVTFHNVKEFHLRPDTPPFLLKACQDAGFNVSKGEDKFTLKW